MFIEKREMNGDREETKEAMNRKEVRKKENEGEDKKRKKGPDDSFKDENLKKSRNQNNEEEKEENKDKKNEKRVSYRRKLTEVHEYEDYDECENITKKRKENEEDDIFIDENEKRGKTTNTEEQQADESVSASYLSEKSESEIMTNIVPDIISEDLFEMFREKCTNIVESEFCIVFILSVWILFCKDWLPSEEIDTILETYDIFFSEEIKDWLEMAGKGLEDLSKEEIARRREELTNKMNSLIRFKEKAEKKVQELINTNIDQQREIEKMKEKNEELKRENFLTNNKVRELDSKFETILKEREEANRTLLRMERTIRELQEKEGDRPSKNWTREKAAGALLASSWEKNMSTGKFIHICKS